MHPARAALDDALANAPHETVTLRRVVGSGNAAQPIDCDCVARVDSITTEQIAAGIKETELNVIISPSAIYDRQWPGGTIPLSGPYGDDPQVPKIGDKLVVRGRVRSFTFLDVKMDQGEMLRINARVSG